MNNNLNPTARKTMIKTLCVDSLFRASLESDPANFMFSLAEPINNVISMKLVTMELPNNWYLFSSKNRTNEFTITCYNFPDSEGNLIAKKSHTILLPDGNYLNTSFVPCLQTYFLNVGEGLQYIRIYINDINATTEFSTGKVDAPSWPRDPYHQYPITDYPDPLDRFYFELDFTIPNKPHYKTLGFAMGFQKTKYRVDYLDDNPYVDIISEGPPVYGAYIASESSYGSTFSHYVFLEIDDFQRNVSSNTIVSYIGNGDSYLNNNIFAKIVVSSGQWTSIIDNAGDFVFKKRNYFGPIKLEKMNIKLLSRFGEIMDLNFNDYSFSLELEVVYS